MATRTTIANNYGEMTSQSNTAGFLFNLTNFQLPTTVLEGEANPWKNESAAQQIIEIIFLTTLCVLGTVGNLTVIFSIILAKRAHSHGNIFIVNLAVADLLVTAFVVPTVIPNVFHRGNALSEATCVASGYVATATITCSLCSLMLIAVNRYWAVAHSDRYRRFFTKKRNYLLVLGSWVWSNLVSLPAVVGWTKIIYDVKIQFCGLDDTLTRGYVIFLASTAIFVPLLVIFLCYFKLFRTVHSSGKRIRKLSSVSSSSYHSEQQKRSTARERNLLKTLVTTVIVFCICTLPYGSIVIIGADSIPAQVKKLFAWIGLSNSAANFIIYGTMNPSFKKNYKNLYLFLFTCKRTRTGATAVFSSFHSDSSNRARRQRRNTRSPVSPRSDDNEPNVRSPSLSLPVSPKIEIIINNNSEFQNHSSSVNGTASPRNAVKINKSSTLSRNEVDKPGGTPSERQPTLSAVVEDNIVEDCQTSNGRV